MNYLQVVCDKSLLHSIACVFFVWFIFNPVNESRVDNIYMYYVYNYSFVLKVKEVFFKLKFKAMHKHCFFFSCLVMNLLIKTVVEYFCLRPKISEPSMIKKKVSILRHFNYNVCWFKYMCVFNQVHLSNMYLLHSK